VVRSSAAGRVCGAYLRLECSVVDVTGPTTHHELVFTVPARKGVHGVPSVSQQVALLGRRPDEPPESPAGDDRAERMHAGSAVVAHRRQLAEPDAMLVEERASRLGERRGGGRECLPAHHGQVLARRPAGGPQGASRRLTLALPPAY
jgi:hypothetical protein